ncbi:MAG: hypothetical protein AMXMBFR13_50830 [Phycisphaerae bacterium]
MLKRLTDIVGRLKKVDSHAAVRLELTEDGFRVLRAGEVEPIASICWAEVLAIRTYKLDLLATDCVCLAFQTARDTWWEILEDDEGFNAVREQMERAFPGIPTMWFMDLTCAAFSASPTVLYPQYEELYQEQENPSSVGRTWGDVLSRGDLLAGTAGLAAFLLLLGTGHPVWLVLAALSAGGTVTVAAAVRKHYDVHDPPAMLLRVLQKQPDALREAINFICRRAYARVVPRRIRAALVVLRLCNGLLLIGGLLVHM